MLLTNKLSAREQAESYTRLERALAVAESKSVAIKEAVRQEPRSLRTANEQKQEMLRRLRVAAQKGSVEPDALLRAIENLDQSLPESKSNDRLIDALVEILVEAAESYRSESGTVKLATKTHRTANSQHSSRDGRGLRKDKPNARPVDGR